MTTYQAFTNTLPEKIKATLVLTNEWGLTVHRHVWLYAYGAKRKDERIYTLTMWAKFQYKGKQKMVSLWLENVTIAEGWQEVNGTINNGNAGEWTSFSKRDFLLAESQLSNVIASSARLKELDRKRTEDMVARQNAMI